MSIESRLHDYYPSYITLSLVQQVTACNNSLLGKGQLDYQYAMAFPTLFVAAVTMLFFLDVAGAERKVSVDVGGNIDKDDIEELYDALTIDNLNTIGVEDAYASQ